MITPEEFDITKLDMNDIKRNQNIFYSNLKYNYDKTKNGNLVIKTEEILSYNGIFDNKYLRIFLNESNKNSKELLKMFRKIDLYMNSDKIKEKILNAFPEFMKNIKLVYHNSIKYFDDYEQIIKIMLNTYEDKITGNVKLGTVYYENKENKIKKLKYPTMDSHSTCKLIIEFSKVWIGQINKEFRYGIKIECKQIEIIHNTKDILDYKNNWLTNEKNMSFNSRLPKENKLVTFIINDVEYTIKKYLILNYVDTTLGKCLSQKKGNSIIKINFEIPIKNKYIDTIFNIYKNGIEKYFYIIQQDSDLRDALKLFLILPNEKYSLFDVQHENSNKTENNEIYTNKIYKKLKNGGDIEQYFRQIYHDAFLKKKLVQFKVLPNDGYNEYYFKKYTKFSDLFKTTLINKLENCGINYEEFIESVNSINAACEAASKAVISGSLILQCILDEHWNSDIDIYIYGMNDFKINDLKIFEKKINKVNESDAKKIDFFDYLKSSKNINKLIKFKLNGVPIDLIFINKPHQDYFKENFDFDFCKNYFDGNQLTILNCDSIINKTCFYKIHNINYLINNSMFIKKRFDKYKSRGFKIVSIFDSDFELKNLSPHEIEKIFDIDRDLGNEIYKNLYLNSYIDYGKYLFANYYIYNEHNININDKYHAYVFQDTSSDDESEMIDEMSHRTNSDDESEMIDKVEHEANSDDESEIIDKVLYEINPDGTLEIIDETLHEVNPDKLMDEISNKYDEEINFIVENEKISINKKYIYSYKGDTYLKLLINNNKLFSEQNNDDIIINDNLENFKIIKDIYTIGVDGLEKYKTEMKNNINFRDLLKFYGFLPNKRYTSFLKIPYDLS